MFDKPLGLWIRQPHHTRRWFYDSATKILYHNNTGIWHSYIQRHSSTRTHQMFEHSMIVQQTPPHLSLATVKAFTGDIVKGYAPPPSCDPINTI